MWNMETDCQYMPLLRDSHAFLQLSLVQTWQQKWKLKDDSIFKKHVEYLLSWKGAQTKFPTVRRVVNEL